MFRIVVPLDEEYSYDYGQTSNLNSINILNDDTTDPISDTIDPISTRDKIIVFDKARFSTYAERVCIAITGITTNSKTFAGSIAKRKNCS